MSTIVKFPARSALAQLDLLERRPKPAIVLRVVPRYLNACRKRVEHECLKIAAGIGNSSVKGILWSARGQLEDWRATPEDIDRQLDEIEEFVDARLELYRNLTGLPGRGDVGRRQRG